MIEVIDFTRKRDSEEMEWLKDSLVQLSVAISEISHACKIVYGNDSAVRKIGLAMPYLFSTIGSSDGVEHIKRTEVVNR